jgi:hypothetical protein
MKADEASRDASFSCQSRHWAAWSISLDLRFVIRVTRASHSIPGGGRPQITWGVLLRACGMSAIIHRLDPLSASSGRSKCRERSAPSPVPGEPDERRQKLLLRRLIAVEL